MLTLSEFINKYKGLTNQGNTPQNLGECVGLVSLWQDNLGVPHEYGNAKDLLTNADTSLFNVIANTPTDYPLAGDIIVWGDTWGNGFGHTAICVTADANSFTSFEQNDITSTDLNGACEVLPHADYSGVLGWLHLKASVTSPDALQTCLQQHQVLVQQANEKDTQIKSLSDTISNLNALNKSKDNDIASLTSTNTSLQTQLKASQNQVATLQPLADGYNQVQKELSQSEQDRQSCLKSEANNEIIISNLKQTIAQGKPQGFWAKLKYVFT